MGVDPDREEAYRFAYGSVATFVEVRVFQITNSICKDYQIWFRLSFQCILLSFYIILVIIIVSKCSLYVLQ